MSFLGIIPLRVHYDEGNSSIHLWVQRQSRYLVVVGDISEKLSTADKLTFGFIDIINDIEKYLFLWLESSTFSGARFQRKLWCFSLNMTLDVECWREAPENSTNMQRKFQINFFTFFCQINLAAFLCLLAFIKKSSVKIINCWYISTFEIISNFFMCN